jgi:uncharacterized protein YcbK (DUF882 family)
MIATTARAADCPDSGAVDRRLLLKLGAAALAATFFSHPLLAHASRALAPSRAISLFNTHTGEKLAVEYYRRGSYAQPALAEINHILRDFRTNESLAMDPALLDILHAITTTLKPGAEIHIISGYRSPATNHTLAQQGTGVATRSLHMDGKAIDFRIPGCDLGTLRQAALRLQAGGVGYYGQSNFVHVDTGPVRFW